MANVTAAPLGIHHINFVVKDLDKRVEYFSHLLQQKPSFDELIKRNVRTAKFKLGESFLVLVEPLTSEGIVADILRTKGEGIFLLSFSTQSIDETLHNLELSYQEKRKGINDWDICDISEYEQFGAILQLTQIE